MSLADLIRKTPFIGVYRNLKSKKAEKENMKLDDKEFLNRIFVRKFGRDIDWDNPVTYNEKLQWLKIYDRKPMYNIIVDKYEVRQYIADRIGEQYLIPLLGVWDRFDEIDFDSLPDSFVLKCTHDSGGLVIVTDKSKFDKKAARKKINESLKRNFYWQSREWPYKDVRPRIIAEKYMTDSPDVNTFTDYKFFCFDGKADNVMIVAGRANNEAKYYHFSKDWQLCRYNRLCRRLPEGFTMDKPEQMDKMFEIAEKLSIGFPEVRVDLYLSDGKIYFGELTLFSNGGFEDGFDIDSDTHLGNCITLPEKTVN
ncbi:MAG: ATP-grasp fold amidoligase family protein [Clostridiaceae bacterium]|nr:ATP-grasp fold amidoligase family protein [Clostridiaceae bacterium]